MALSCSELVSIHTILFLSHYLLSKFTSSRENVFFQSRRNQSKPPHLTKKDVHLRTSAASGFKYNNVCPFRVYFNSYAFSESVESMASQMVESLKSERHHCMQGKELWLLWLLLDTLYHGAAPLLYS